ncbi:MAG TPA: four helix bundle protein [Vicinamibacterales bacterium]|nr:four helix bundle protein [Vicinamibacterales bacterium]
MQRFTDLRAWQACVTYKRAIYRVCEKEPLVNDWKRRGQLEESVAGPPGHLAEGFGRFSPLDFARFVAIARASLLESQNHLIDLVDRRYISDEQRTALNALAESALQEVTGLLEYLQSPEAARNAQRARERGIARRTARRTGTSNPEPRTPQPRTPEPRTTNHAPNPEPESRTENRTRTRTRKREPGTGNGR